MKMKIGIGVFILILISSLIGGGYEYKKEKALRISTQKQLKTTQSSLSKTAKALTIAEASSRTFSNQEVVRNGDGSVFLDGQGKPIILTRSGSETASRSSSTLDEAIASATSSIENIDIFNSEENETITIKGVKKLGLMYGFKPFDLKHQHHVGGKFRQKVFIFEMAAGAMIPVPSFDYREIMFVIDLDF